MEVCIMRATVIFSLVLLFSLTESAAATNHPDGNPYTKHDEKGFLKKTQEGLFSVKLVLKGDELKVGVNDLDMVVRDEKGKDVVGAVITVTPWMPEMGHGSFEKPAIRERGKGLYGVENIMLIMRGHWELRMTIKKGETEDMVIFDFPDVKSIGQNPFN
jgi:hypothetical protein